MPSSASARSPARRHPLVVAVLAALAVRGLGLVLHYYSRDPNGNPISASPVDNLMIAVPYHGIVLITAAAALLLLWKVVRPARPVITLVGIALSLAAAVVGQVDLAMQWFMGHRFSPNVAGTYVGGSLLSDDILGPLSSHPAYVATGFALMLAPVVPISRSLSAARRGVPLRPPGWRLIGSLFALAALCRVPLALAYDPQLTVARPPELLFAAPSAAIVAPDQPAAAIATLRAQIDPTGASGWVDDSFPIARTPPPARNRYLAGAVPDPLPDIFVFAVESLRGAEVGFVPGNDRDGDSATPHLDALARTGVVFSSYISTGSPSPRGFFGINTGVWDHRESFIISGHTETEFDALPLRLRRAGYFTLGVWGANPSFDNQTFWASRWFDRVSAPEPPVPFAIVHSLADDRVFDHLIAEVDAHDRERPDQPIYAYVANHGTHEPFEIMPGSALPDSVVRRIAQEKDRRARYRMVLREYDAQIGRFLTWLRGRRSPRPRLLVVVGDHGELAGDAIPPELRGQPHDALEWTAGLIAGPQEWIGPPRVETFPSGHADLMPTILDLIGDRGPTIAMGTNLFADVPAEARTAVSNSGWGYRLDRTGWTLIVERLQPDVVFTGRSFGPAGELRAGLDGSPFTPDAPRRLVESQDAWSWLIEQNRVWRPSLLDRPATPPAAPTSAACGSPTPSGGAASPGCPTGSTSEPPADRGPAPTR